MLTNLPFHPLDPFQTDPAIIESQSQAQKLTRYYCERGLDAFEFRNEAGRHYVVARGRGAEECLLLDQLVSFTSARMVEALDKPWADVGRA
ncbi:hypothetical protein ACTG4Q_20835 [Bradyrhizobium denitrificans]